MLILILLFCLLQLMHELTDVRHFIHYSALHSHRILIMPLFTDPLHTFSISSSFLLYFYFIFASIFHRPSSTRSAPASKTPAIVRRRAHAGCVPPLRRSLEV
jgi:hypothetical protein